MEYLAKFDNLKPATQNIERYNEYITLIFNFFMSLYEVDLNDMIDEDAFWMLLVNDTKIGCCNGHFGHAKYNTGLNESGKREMNGVLCLNGQSYDGKTVEVKYLKTENPIRLFTRYANQLAEVDLSQKVLVQATRAGQIIPVSSVTEKQKIDKCFDNVKSGKLQTYVFEWTPFEDDKKPLELFDPQRFHSMEYLSSYHCELVRRLFSLFGFAMAGKDKQAQLNNSEVEDREQPAVLLPILILDEMQKSFKKCNEAFGTNFSIKPSKLLDKVIRDALITDEDIIEATLNKKGVGDNETEPVTE